MRSRGFRWTWTLLVALLLQSCGGSGGGAGGGAASEGLPEIQAWLAAFPTENIPAGGLGADGGSALLLVSLGDVGAASAAGTVVEANGRKVEFDVASGAYRVWLLLSTRTKLSLTIRRGAQSWSVEGNLVDVYPDVVSPRQRDNFPINSVVMPEAPRSRALRVAWTGELPSAEHRWAVIALDATGQLSWPASNRFELLTDSTARKLDLPPGALRDTTTGHAAVGVARSVPIAGAGAGSTLTLAAFSQSELFVTNSDGPAFGRLEIAPRWIAVGVGRNQPLAAHGYTRATVTFPDDMQDATTRVSWSTDDPQVATVSGDGVLRGVAPGTTTVRINGGGLGAASSVRVLPTATAPTTSNVSTVRVDTMHTGAAAARPVGVNSTFPASPLWSKALRGSLSYPLMADGKIFVLALPWDSNGDSRLRLHALDAVTGADAWQSPAVLSSFHRAGQFALEGQRLVVVTGDCLAIAIDARSGNRLWTVDLGQTLPHVWQCDAPPTIRNGIAYLSMSGVAVTVAALDMTDGSVLWSRRVSLSGGAPPTVTDAAVYLGSLQQGYKIDALSGVVQWRHSGLGSGGGASINALKDGRLYLDEPESATTDSVVLDAGGGAILGRFASFLAPAVNEEFLFTSQLSSVSALRVVDRQLVWTASAATFLAAPPIVAGGALLLPLTNGEVEWRDSATGLLWWRLTSPGSGLSTGGIQLRPGIAVGQERLVVPMSNLLAVYAWPSN